MRKTFVFILFCLLAASVKAQVNATDSVNTEELPSSYVSAEYPGGKEKLFDTINSNFEYPASLKSRGIEGTIVAEGTIGTDGTYTPENFTFEKMNIKITRDEAALFVKEFRRAIKKLKKWKPAEYKGQAIESKFKLTYNLGIFYQE